MHSFRGHKGANHKVALLLHPQHVFILFDLDITQTMSSIFYAATEACTFSATFCRVLMSSVLGHVDVWLCVRLQFWEDCSVGVEENKTLTIVYSIITKLLTAPSSVETPGFAASMRVCVSVCVFYTFWSDRRLDALLCISNLWPSLPTDLGPDVKASAAHLKIFFSFSFFF